ncbi:DUF6286 domain-containing protein [Actinomadura rugatobispora]|uniref:DUF6286 domain-containing protein n=1 Tax=Actinomadura rugatobispora TaxID=1994 RepID=A0ABW0ZT60_9ACTN|nr:hypothetical protein GCM10010200_028740 [Actinomadura rugatobispora]
MTTHAGQLPKHGPGGASAAPSGRTAARAADRAARRAFRSRRLWLALPAALLITVVGVLTAIETISALAGSPARLVPYERVAAWATGARYKDWAPLLISAVLALLGLLLLPAGLLPGRGRLVPLHGDDPELVVGITRHGLRNVVADAARSVEGVEDVHRAKVRRHRAKVVVGTAMHEPGDLDERVAEAVRRRLDEIGPMPARRVAVAVRRPEH